MRLSTTKVLTLKTRAKRSVSSWRSAPGRYSARSSCSGTRNSAATRLHHASVCCVGESHGVTSDKADSPSHTWASSCARGEHLRGLGIRPVDEHQGARSSARANPRNSSGSSLRWLLLPTTPVTMTKTPAASARSMNKRRASVQVGDRRRSPDRKTRPAAWRRQRSRRRSATLAEPTNGRGVSPRTAGVVAVPLLALFAEIDGVQQVGARMADTTAPNRAQVRNRDSLDGRFLQEQVAHRRPGWPWQNPRAA